MMLGSSSYENKVRFNKHSFTGKACDRLKLDITKEDELKIRSRCEARVSKGEKYDYLGLIRFLIFNVVESKDKSFCSEVCTTELQEYVPELKDLVPHKTSPNDMEIALKFGVFK